MIVVLTILQMQCMTTLRKDMLIRQFSLLPTLAAEMIQVWGTSMNYLKISPQVQASVQFKIYWIKMPNMIKWYMFVTLITSNHRKMGHY